MSPGFFRNLAMLAALSLTVVGGATAFAQEGLFSDGFNFLKAVRDGDAQKVTDVVENPQTRTLINTRDQSSGQTALHIVAEQQNNLWIDYLTAYGANPNVADKNGVTPLMISARLGHVEGATTLLEAGARVDGASTTGETPLILAIHRRDIPLMRVLLSKGADPARTDNSGRSARDYVEQIGDRRLAEAFAEELAKRENSGNTQQYGPSL